jgi:hypothetical protein
MSGRYALFLLALCSCGPVVVLVLLVNRQGSIGPDANVAGASVTGARAHVEQRASTPVLPQLPPPTTPQRWIDTNDPWTGEALPQPDPGGLHHRIVTKPARPIDMTDPWDPTRSYAPAPEEIRGVVVAAL